jgi:glycosyltransferase involved in cell wall biosynthesis
MLVEPRISIVVPSFNQARYLDETLQSLAKQNYPNLEVIVQDGGSTDDSVRIASKYAQSYPHIFNIFVEKDHGQAHGLNLGFQKTTGTILGFLNSDDTLLDGCLERVAKEIDPEQGRFIVMGRCLFTGEGAPYVGVEHPCEFVDHFHQLAIWKRGINTVPQPSVFWHRAVWEKCGGLDESQSHVLDYELFCRFSKHFAFHKVDELWATYRIHESSKTFTRSEKEVLDLAVAASRIHWGPWWSFLRWRCEISFWLQNPENFEKARHFARLAEEAFAKKRFGTALKNAFATFRQSPKLTLNRLVRPFLLHRFFPLVECSLLRKQASWPNPAKGYADGWIGPNFADTIDIPKGAKSLVLRMEFTRPRPIKTKIHFLIAGRIVRKLTLQRSERLRVVLDVAPFAGKKVTLQIASSTSFTPSDYHDTSDHRILSLRILEQRFD